jgi:hypothetical protein
LSRRKAADRRIGLQIDDLDPDHRWLRRQLDRYAVTWSGATGGAARAAFANDLLVTCLTLRSVRPGQVACLPDVPGEIPDCNTFPVSGQPCP